MRHLPIALLTIVLLSCGKTDNTKEKGWEYLAASRQEYVTGQYQQAEAFIDSLRQKCPKAIDARKDAIILLDSIHIEQAKLELDSLESYIASIQNPDRFQKDSLDFQHDEAVQKVRFFERKLQYDIKNKDK